MERTFLGGEAKMGNSDLLRISMSNTLEERTLLRLLHPRDKGLLLCFALRKSDSINGEERNVKQN